MIGVLALAIVCELVTVVFATLLVRLAQAKADRMEQALTVARGGLDQITYVGACLGGEQGDAIRELAVQTEVEAWRMAYRRPYPRQHPGRN